MPAGLPEYQKKVINQISEQFDVYFRNPNDAKTIQTSGQLIFDKVINMGGAFEKELREKLDSNGIRSHKPNYEKIRDQFIDGVKYEVKVLREAEKEKATGKASMTKHTSDAFADFNPLGKGAEAYKKLGEGHGAAATKSKADAASKGLHK